MVVAAVKAAEAGHVPTAQQLRAAVQRGKQFPDPRPEVLCRCDCGEESIVFASNLRRGTTRSCGCLDKETKPNLKHGMRRTQEYSTWTMVLQRCTNSRSKYYKDYGGRGITVCDLWRHGDGKKTGFECWLDYIRENLGSRPTPKHSLDRINNDGNYEPGNIRWATQKEDHLADAILMAVARRQVRRRLAH